jgi:hypothetical protein
VPDLAVTPPSEAPARAGSPRHADALLVACALSWLSAFIHVQAAVDHFDEYWPYATAFVLVAVLQAAWGVAAYRRPGRGLLVAGALGGLAVAMAWLCSRTVGLPVGPDRGAPETAGLLDVAATANELVLVGLVVVALRRGVRRGLARGLMGSALLLIVLGCLLLAGGLHAH